MQTRTFLYRDTPLIKVLLCIRSQLSSLNIVWLRALNEHPPLTLQIIAARFGAFDRPHFGPLVAIFVTLRSSLQLPWFLIWFRRHNRCNSPHALNPWAAGSTKLITGKSGCVERGD
jgi:hypothetical protein